MGFIVGVGSLMFMHRYLGQQLPPNSSMNNSLRCPNLPILGNIQHLLIRPTDWQMITAMQGRVSFVALKALGHKDNGFLFLRISYWFKKPAQCSFLMIQQIATFVGAGSLMPVQCYPDQQFLPNSKIHNSLRLPNPPTLESACHLRLNHIDNRSVKMAKIICRGGFSHVDTVSFGAAIPVRQRNSHQLEAPKPAHSGKHASFTNQTIQITGASRWQK